MINDKFIKIVEAVTYIAINATPEAVKGSEVCQAQNLPPRYLEPILQELARGSILKSIRGPKGGYVLARERRNINLRDIYEVLFAEDVKLAELKKAVGAFLFELEKTTIDDLCAKADMQARKQKVDFDI